MASVNKVILVGNLGRDPEVRYMPNGDAIANIAIATTESWKDKQGQRQEKTEWHNVCDVSSPGRNCRRTPEKRRLGLYRRPLANPEMVRAWRTPGIPEWCPLPKNDGT